MPNLAAVLKTEIRRLARKEAKASTAPLRKIVRALRRKVADQKRSIEDLERSVRRAKAAGALAVAAGAAGREGAAGASEGLQVRFSPRWVRKHREKLKMSRRIYAKLVGVSAQSIFGWESGRARPRRSALAAWHRLRSMGAREIKALLEGGAAGRGGGRKRRAKAGRRAKPTRRANAARRVKATRRARPVRGRSRRVRRAKKK
ncbi:MAG: helix-turn-helix transcriptional regulator [Candidatus Latescibacteria bacterium]|nr:helix-turn-helix transcriptional regulator [Candidatus Latescibacterota bacterium]